MRTGYNTFGLLSVALAAALSVAPAQAQRGLGQGKAAQAKNAKSKKTPPLAGQASLGKARSGQGRSGQAGAPPAQNNGTAAASQSKPEKPLPQQPNAARLGARNVPAGQNVPPQWMERLQKLPPAEQERFMTNNERFRNLPPEQKAQIRDRLHEFRQLSPEERQKLRERADVWEKIPLEQRQRVRQEILPRWKQMSPDRREEIKHRLNALNGLSEQDRAAKLRDPNFVRGLDSSEQDMLRNLSNLRVTPATGAVGNHQ